VKVLGGSVGVVGNGVPPALGVSSPPQEINERLIIKKLKNILFIIYFIKRAII
jgi:hypothetical protein